MQQRKTYLNDFQCDFLKVQYFRVQGVGDSGLLRYVVVPDCVV